MLTTVAVGNYRSLHDLRIRLAPITVVTGANGVGKSGLYRALKLLAECASGQVIGSIAREGVVDPYRASELISLRSATLDDRRGLQTIAYVETVVGHGHGSGGARGERCERVGMARTSRAGEDLRPFH